MTRVLIIGGSGLISTPITRMLLERGDEVVLYNRGQSEARFPPGASQIVGDRTDYGAFEAALAAAGHFDCVIDMVCYRPAEAESLVRAVRGRAGQLILCSTVDVYARPADRYPIVENEPQRPASAYGADKSRCEAIVRAAHEQGLVPVTIMRPAQTYGEGGRLVHSLGWRTTYLDRIRRGKPIVVHGDGNSLWCACHIDDVARAFVAAIGAEHTFGRAYHVTGEEWMTWNRYHAGVAEATGAPAPQLVHIPTDLLARAAPTRARISAENFQFNNIFDNSAARADLGFRYTIPWVAGVRRTVAWLDANNKIENSDDDPFDDHLIAAWQRLGEQLVAATAALDGA
jgi:nucleoside-diphosphate-sugar epimerase